MEIGLIPSPLKSVLFRKGGTLLLFFIFFSFHAQQNEIEKKAEQLFEEQEYAEAYKLYAQLVSNYPKNALYNYRLGVCMIFSEPDKKKCFPYLHQAYKQKAELPKDVCFFLGKAYHLNYRFNEALKYYNEFKESAGSSMQKKYEVDREIRSCINGKQLLSEITGLEILQKKNLNESDYFRSYDIQTLNGKLLAKPEEFKTSADRRKKDKSVIFVPNGSSKIFFSSYGENSSNGKDIYYRLRLPSGDFGKPIPVPVINTPYDEDYPYLCPDGKTLYFSSKGHNSMGGYDIFRAIYDENTDTWSTPENMEFPINSPDDDYLFVPAADGKTAFFSTSRYSPPGRVDVLKVNTERKPIPLASMHAEVVKENAQQSVLSKITIRNLDADTLVGKFEADEQGRLEMFLPNGANLLYTVETPGLPTQSENVRIPYSRNLKHYRQTIAYENKKLRIINHFDEPKTDDSYIQYLKIIEEKAKLNPELYVPRIVKEIKGEGAPVKDTTPVVKNTGPQVTDYSPPPPSVIASNLQQTDKDLKNNKNEQKLTENRIREMQKKMQELKISSSGKNKQAEDILNSIPEDQRENNPDVLKATEWKKEADKEQTTALLMEEQVRNLEKQKQYLEQEEKLLNQKKELLTALSRTPKADPQTENQLKEIEKNISETSEKRQSLSSEISINNQKAEAELAQIENEIRYLEKQIREKENEISDKEAQLQNTKKKKQKESLKQEIADAIREVQNLNAQKINKEQELVTRKNEAEKQQYASEEIRKIMDYRPITTDEPESGSIPPVGSPVPLTELEKKHSSSIQPYDQQNPDAYSDAIEKIITYNQSIDASLLAYNLELNREKNPQKNKAIRNEIARLENRKKQNNRLLEEYAKKREVLVIENKMQMTQTAATIPFLSEQEARQPESMNKIREITESDKKFFSGNSPLHSITIPSSESQKLTRDFLQQNQKLNLIVQELQSINSSDKDQNSVTLQYQADQIMKSADSIRKVAQTRPDNERIQLNRKASELEKEYLQVQVKAYEARISENEMQTQRMKEDAEKVLGTAGNQGKGNEWKQQMEEISNYLRQYQELNQESKMASNTSARMGSLENALEKQQMAMEKLEKMIKEMHQEYPDITLRSLSKEKNQEQTAEKVQQLREESQKYNEIKQQLLSVIQKDNVQQIEQYKSRLQLQPPSNASPAEKQLILKINSNLDKLGSSSGNETVASLQTLVAGQYEILQDMNTLLSLQKARTEQEKSASMLASANQRENLRNTPPPPNRTRENMAPETVAANTNNTPPVRNNPPPPSTDAFNTREVIYSVELSLKNNQDTSITSLNAFLSNNNPPLQNAEAENRKNIAINNIRTLQNEINKIYSEKQETSSGNEQTAVSEQEIIRRSEELEQEAEALFSEIERMKNTGQSSRDDIRAREQKLNSLKAEAATLRMQIFSAHDKAYMTSIEQGIERMQQQKHPSLQEAQELLDKINNQKKQSRQIRDESESLSGAARWGSLGNAEEMENEILLNEKKLLKMIQSIFPDLPYEPPKFTNISSTPSSLDENQKKNIRQKQTQQVSELFSLINAHLLNLESFKPSTRTLNETQKQQWLEILKRKNLIQELARKANEEPNLSEKIRWLTTAVKESVIMSGQLGTFQSTRPALAYNPDTRPGPPPNNNPNNERQNTQNNNALAVNRNTRENRNPVPNITERRTPGNTESENTTGAPAQKVFVTDGMEILNRNAYSDARPIPINEPPPSGLIFRVQIGVFKNQIPNNAFRGLTPVHGETTPDGSIKYTAGNFRRFEVATGVKKELNRNGYPDAFVVAYYNGKRISLTQALQIMENEGKQPDIAQADNIRINANIAPIIPIVPANPVQEPVTDQVTISGELEKIKKLLYTVQIGVYSRQISKSRLKNLEPIYTEKLPGGLYRYTAGIYNNDQKVITDKNRVIALGISDAFVSAYLEGKRTNFNEIRQKIAGGETFAFENENPIRFPENAPPAPVVNNENPPPPDVIPFKNNVSSYPEATPENGIKNTEEGICFKVQIGAYSRQVPPDVAERFNKISTWPVEHKYINQLFIYNVGNFADKNNAQKLRDEIINLGIPDAFITVYKDGKKLFGEEARSYLMGN